MENSTHKKRVAIFASGTGSNARVIIEKAEATELNYEVVLVVSNKANAGVLQIAKDFSILTLVIEKESFFNANEYVKELQDLQIDWIILAGFLWKMPIQFVNAFPNRIINIHPALLPKYGGKGMYGAYVHEAVINNKETETGITIHYVNEQYDEGTIILQKSCTITEKDTAETVAAKVHELEHQYFYTVINELTK